MKTSHLKNPQGLWYVVDAEGKTLGRLATTVATVLRGKHRPSFSPHQLANDHVIILNVEKLAFNQMKLIKKLYHHHTGYLGHLQTRTLEKMMKDHPDRVMKLAVKGMLPYNRLKFQAMRHLHIFKGNEHPHAAQKPVPLDMSSGSRASAATVKKAKAA